jgi:hypothetical protein
MQHRRYEVFFTNRIHGVMNELPGSVVDSESIAVLKSDCVMSYLSAHLRYPGMPYFRLISVELHFHNHVLFT